MPWKYRGEVPTEADVIAATSKPATVESLAKDLVDLGVSEGDLLIVHSSLSALGWIAGGAQAAVEALLAVVGNTGTIVMPTQSGQLSDPASWNNPPVPADWIETVRDGLPAYDPELTPTRQMGQIVEVFRQMTTTIRSPHPLVSFATQGPLADEIVGEHPLTPNCGETSPLGRLYDNDAKVLLLGVGHGNNTSIHLAEYRADWPSKSTATESAPVLVDGERRWVSWSDVESDDEDFARLGAAFAQTGHEHSGPVGAGVGVFCSQRAVVDFATNWLSTHRQ